MYHDRMVRLPDVYLWLPVKIKSGDDDLDERPAIDLNERKRHRTAERDDRHDDEQPRLYKEIAYGAYEPRRANKSELAEGERPYQLIFGVDELWYLVLHVSSL